MADEERRLVDAAQRGDGESFNALVRLYESRVYNLIYRMLGDTESAADTTQDTFILAYRRLNTFRGGSFTETCGTPTLHPQTGKRWMAGPSRTSSNLIRLALAGIWDRSGSGGARARAMI